MPFANIPLDTAIKGPLLLEPKVFGDERGFFLESYHQEDLRLLGVMDEFVQDNQSRSRQGTLRGLHFQRQYPQAKLVRVLRGKAFDVVVDLRAGSPTEGHWCGCLLDDEYKRIFYVPVGFAHGFLALSAEVDLAYKCSDYYHPEDEQGLIWNDLSVGIAWPLQEVGMPLLSIKDKGWPGLRNLEFRFGGPQS